MTMSAGLYASFRLPTALAERMYSTPSVFRPKMFARKFSSDGDRRCPAPWRARRDALPAQRPEQVGARRLAKRRRHRHVLAIGDAGHVIQAGPADDANLRSKHIHLGIWDLGFGRWDFTK